MTRKDKNMKTTMKIAFFLMLSTALGLGETLGLADSSRQFNAWIVYPAVGNQSVLLQVTSQLGDKDIQGTQVQAKLDVVCRKDRVVALAVETDLPIEKSSLSFSDAVPTTRVAFVSGDQTVRSENWAVLNGGRTLSPYSEAFQGRLNRYWMQRLVDNQKLTLHLGSASGDVAQPTFDTRELSEALSSAGCRY
jgi:hypothetical protein